MPRLITYYLITLLLAISVVVYAGNPKTCPVTSLTKTYCKATSTLCKLKTCKTHIHPKATEKLQDKSNDSDSPTTSPANTFETIIAPFIKTIAPHFYERILKNEETKLPEVVKSREA